jgi:GNAT superfamily N-acetyltransferase
MIKKLDGIMDIEFIEGNQDLLDWISPLWAKLNSYHRHKSRHFAAYYDRLTFQQWKAILLAKAQNGLMRVDLVRLKDEDDYIGYSVTTISAANEGEIESLFVIEPYRKQGIGHALMQRAINWLDRHRVKVRRLAVAVGNDKTLAFYEQFGFYPKFFTLEQVEQKFVLGGEGAIDNENVSEQLALGKRTAAPGAAIRLESGRLSRVGGHSPCP